MLTRMFMMLLLGGCAGGAGSLRPVGTNTASDVLSELERAFPRSVEVNAEAPPLVQFCPENTCEAFTSRGGASVEELADFAFLFVYYFSEYRVLNKWRAAEVPRLLAERVVARRMSSGHAVGDAKVAAACVLRAMASQRRIRVEGIRYDEGVRAVVPIALP